MEEFHNSNGKDFVVLDIPKISSAPLPFSAPQIELCPECGEGQLIYKRLNCKECLNCNWSLCGM